MATQVISRVVLKASVHRVPEKTYKGSRGPVGAYRKVNELVVNATEAEFEKRWAEAQKILTEGFKKPAAPKPKPKPAAPKPKTEAAPKKDAPKKTEAKKPAPKKE